MSEDRRPLETVADLVVYAPLGFALEARRMFPTFAERGRNQIAMTRMIGRFAVDQGRGQAARGFGKLASRADGLLQEFGLRPMPEDPGPTEPTTVDEPEIRVVDTPAVAERATQPAADLAIPGYDSLAASQVIPRLAGLSEEELAEIARHETAHRGRKTILGKISQLRTG